MSVTLRLSRTMGLAALAAAALTVAGCDRQNAAPPQASETAGGEGKSADVGAQRYRVDRAGAGTPLSTASVRARDGSATTLASLSGKPVLVNLWATWCAPCIEELPTLNRVASEVGSAGHVIALSQDLHDDPAPVHAFLSDKGWTEIASWHDPDNEVGLTVGGQLPTTILYDASGKEVVRVIGPMDWYGDEAKALLREAGFVLEES